MFVLALLACQGTLTADRDEGTLPTDGSAPPELALEAPAAASFLAAGPHEVTGRAVHIDAVTVNGVPATVSGNAFSAPLDLPVGMTTLEAAGGAHTDSWSVLAGDVAPADGVVGDAVQLHLSPEGLDALTPLVGEVLDPVALSAQLTALNPVLDTPDARVDLTGLTFDPVELSVVPGNGVLDVQIVLPVFVLGIEATIADALPFGIDLTLEPDLAADRVVLATTLDLEPDGQGGLTAVVGPVDASLEGFDLDTGILELVDWLFLDDDDLAVMLETQLAGLGSGLGPLIDEQLAALDLSLETELLGTALTVEPSFDRVDITPAGVGLGVGVQLDVDAPAPDAPGHLTFPAPPPQGSGELSAQISDAFMNRALFELWAGGALDLDLPLAEEPTILFLFGGQDDGHLSLRAGLPPVWLERDGEARLQLGEAALTVDTPGGQYGDRLELVLAIDAKAALKITPEAVGVVLSDAQVKMRTTGASRGNEALEAFLPDLATAFGLGIGMVNELLSVPLDVALPELTPERDPSGLGTKVALTVDDLLPLLGVTPPPAPPAVPGTAAVHEDDETVTTDAAEGWVCGNAEVEVDADAGTWFVDADGVLVLLGTGHTVYAVAGAEVVVEGGGNTVHADPGATVDDEDGGNTVFIVDPLVLDLASAPSPGCAP